MYSMILCGGSGTRLWPLSRKNFPKQFLKLYSDNSLLQETFLRMREIMPLKNIYFVTNEDNFFNVFNQIKDIEKDFDREQILVEPASLNTAPAIALAMNYLAEKVKISYDEPVIILPSDHYIGKKEDYLNLIKFAAENVGDMIGTIAITPTSPHTGYGYIKKGQKEKGFFKVAEFKEKPDAQTAQKYLSSGDYAWNSGMYVFNIKSFSRELKEHASEIYDLIIKDYDTFIEKFNTLPSISIDYAISEKSQNVVVFEGEFGWNDIGSFDSLADISSQNKDNRNSQNKQISVDSNNIYVHSTNDKVIATIGVDDLVIVENNDSILIHKRGRAEDVKKVVEILKERKLKEIDHNLIVQRPWGTFEVLIDNPLHKVKKITVFPNAKLSLQEHMHRVEHWVVVRGVAKIVNGEDEVILRENESTFIPSITKHRLENPGKINLEIIEVQTGNYLEEDDIIRYDDIYGRLWEGKKI